MDIQCQHNLVQLDSVLHSNFWIQSILSVSRLIVNDFSTIKNCANL